MKQTLYLLRHARAEAWLPGINDFERHLSDRGLDHMRRLAAWAGENLPRPDAVMCSPSRRTVQTIEPLLEAWPGLGDNTRYSPEIYEATTGTLHALAGEAFKTYSSVMIVGHNPGFEDLALVVLKEAESGEIHKMATGTLAVIDFPGSFAADCGQGILKHWVRRKDLSGD